MSWPMHDQVVERICQKNLQLENEKNSPIGSQKETLYIVHLTTKYVLQGAQIAITDIVHTYIYIISYYTDKDFA